MDIPDPRYARCGDVQIAYQVVGDGPIDLLFSSGWVFSFESLWEYPTAARFVRRLASFSRLIMFDRRGTGLSDPITPTDPPTLEQWSEDALAVLDAAGSERAAVFGWGVTGGAASIMFAATHPERVSALVLFGVPAKGSYSEDYPWGPRPEDGGRIDARIRDTWGTDAFWDDAPAGMRFDRDELDWMKRSYRRGASPSTALTITRGNRKTDIRGVLGSITVPTLVMHRTYFNMPVERERHLADQIAGSRFVDLGEGDLLPWRGDSDRMLDEIQEFLTGVRPEQESDRVLATVMFSDIVSSTERVAAVGDRRWAEILEGHDQLVRRELTNFRGREVAHTGDGFLATFDGPARAVRCARAIGESAAQLGVPVRAGLHTGEIEVRGGDIRGIAVHIGQRVSALAGPGEVLVSRTVTDLVAGSGLEFEDRGEHELKGVPGRWQLYAVR